MCGSRKLSIEELSSDIKAMWKFIKTHFLIFRSLSLTTDIDLAFLLDLCHVEMRWFGPQIILPCYVLHYVVGLVYLLLIQDIF